LDCRGETKLKIDQKELEALAQNPDDPERIYSTLLEKIKPGIIKLIKDVVEEENNTKGKNKAIYCGV